jgi:hypothetical protein
MAALRALGIGPPWMAGMQQLQERIAACRAPRASRGADPRAGRIGSACC